VHRAAYYGVFEIDEEAVWFAQAVLSILDLLGEFYHHTGIRRERPMMNVLDQNWIRRRRWGLEFRILYRGWDTEGDQGALGCLYETPLWKLFDDSLVMIHSSLPKTPFTGITAQSLVELPQPEERLLYLFILSFLLDQVREVRDTSFPLVP
jgi:hypothetical protein